jgi:hypothetical protein
MNMEELAVQIPLVLALMAAGLTAGFAAGLFGIGGGFYAGVKVAKESWKLIKNKFSK